MKRRVAKCRCLVGWADQRMTEPKTCGQPATHLLVPWRVPACAEHVEWNKKKDLTYCQGEGSMLGAGKGSSYERMGA